MTGQPPAEEKLAKHSGFLSDRALEDLSQDQLGHHVYVNALKRIILTCHTPFTIGVLGKWGTGKTSIGTILLKEFSGDDELRNRFKTMLFDVWKYPGDSLRRKFLLQTAGCLSSEQALEQKDRLWQELYGSTSRQSESTSRFDPSAARWWWPILALYIVVVAGVVLWFRTSIPSLANLATGVSVIVGVLLASLGALRSFFTETRSSSTTTSTIPPLHSPEQFEQRFEALLSAGNISSGPDASRLIVVVDNLDRCSSDSAVDALRTIKTFLDKDGCIFVIPCDDEALREHLSSIYEWKKDSDDAFEYLRKFFNTTIRITSSRQDLIQLVENLTSETGFSKDVAEVLWAAAPDNPRRVKEFLNRLRAMEIIAEQEEMSGRLARTVRQNLPFLAKVTVLRERWPGLIEHLARDDRLLIRLREALMNPDLLSDESYNDLNQYIGDEPKPEYDGLKEFLRATSPVRTEDPRAFLQLRQDSYEVVVEETVELRQALRLGSVERVRELLGAKDPPERIPLWQIIRQVIDEERKANREQRAMSSVIVAMENFESCPDELGAVVANTIASTVCSFGSWLPDVLPSKILAVLEDADRSWARAVIDRVIGGLAEISPFSRDVVEAIPQHHQLFTDEQLGHIGAFLATELSGDWGNAVTLLDGMTPAQEGVRRLFAAGPELLAAIVARLEPEDLEQSSRAADIYLRFRDFASESVQIELMKCIGSLLTYPTTPPMGHQKELALSILDQLELSDIPQASMDSLSHTLRTAITAVDHIPNKRRLLPQVLRLRNKTSNGEVRNIDSVLSHCVLTWPVEEVRALTDLESLRVDEGASKVCRLTVESRIADDARPSEEKAPLLEAYVGLLPPEESEELGEFLGRLIDSTSVQTLVPGAQATEKYFDRFPRGHQLELLDRLRERSQSLDAAHKRLTLAPLTSLVKKTDPLELRNGIGHDLLVLMKSPDPSSFQLGAEQYRVFKERLSLERRAMIARELITNLDTRRLQINNSFVTLISLVIEEADNPKVGSQARIQLAYLLLSMTQADMTEEQRLLGISGLAEYEHLPAQARPAVIEQLQTIVADRDSPEPVRKAATGALIRYGEVVGQE